MPDEGMYSQRDPIGIAGGNPSLYGYVWDSTRQSDVWGLAICGSEGIGKHTFPKTKNDFKQLFGIDIKLYHSDVKPVILKQISGDPVYGKLFKKMGKNPDIGITELGNIVLKDVKTGKTLETDWLFELFLP